MNRDGCPPREVRNVDAATLDRVFAALEREADLDDVATVSAVRLGPLVGISQPTASRAIRLLAAQGRVQIGRRVGRGGIFEVHVGGAA